MNRTAILMGRLHKLENFQARTLNLMNCRVSDGQLPDHVRESIRTPEMQAKFQKKIDKAEMIKLKIAIAIYDDIGV